MDSRTPLLDDPFWSVVATRHPDVEIVLLPGDEPGVGVATIDATAAQVAATLDAIEECRSRLGLAGLEIRGSEIVPGPTPDSVEVRFKHSALSATGAETLESIAQCADHAEQRDGEVLVVSAAFGLLRVRATWALATRVLVVRISSPALRVGTDLADQLLGRV